MNPQRRPAILSTPVLDRTLPLPRPLVPPTPRHLLLLPPGLHLLQLQVVPGGVELPLQLKDFLRGRQVGLDRTRPRPPGTRQSRAVKEMCREMLVYALSGF